MSLYSVALRPAFSGPSSVLEIVCQLEDLGSLAYILDTSDKVLEYAISSPKKGRFVSNEDFPYEKLVTGFNWGNLNESPTTSLFIE